MGRILGVDPGSKNLGIALSDPSGTIANPLKVLTHISRPANATAIVALAEEHNVEAIVIGQSLDQDGQPTFEGRRAGRLAAEVSSHTGLDVQLWDEGADQIDLVFYGRQFVEKIVGDVVCCLCC